MTEQKPAWLEEAWRHIGVAERRGKASDPRILAFYRDAGHDDVVDDAVAWCAAFVGACLARTEQTPTGSLRARSYLDWGVSIASPRAGAIAVFSRGSNPAIGHVGFVVGSDDDSLMILGGNQSDTVSVASYPQSRLLALRWPSGVPVEAPAKALFDTIIDHIFAMEGGYTDDPHDPGGPTHRGITLATYATWRNVAVTPDTFAGLKAELRSLDRASAAAIFRARYWQPSNAEAMPPALALMHFDASVNHGLTGARRLLHLALGLDPETSLGAETHAAIASLPLENLIDRYAAQRTAKYRALPHFWRFGRGWLNRVAKTRAAALTLIKPTPTTAKDPAMTTLPSDPTPKWWGNSLTIWGTIITTLTTVLPAIGPLFGIDLTGEMIVNLGHSLTALIQAAGGVAGSVMAIYGRIRATQPLTRRAMSLRL